MWPVSWPCHLIREEAMANYSLSSVSNFTVFMTNQIALIKHFCSIIYASKLFNVSSPECCGPCLKKHTLSPRLWALKGGRKDRHPRETSVWFGPALVPFILVPDHSGDTHGPQIREWRAATDHHQVCVHCLYCTKEILYRHSFLAVFLLLMFLVKLARSQVSRKRMWYQLFNTSTSSIITR